MAIDLSKAKATRLRKYIYRIGKIDVPERPALATAAQKAIVARLGPFSAVPPPPSVSGDSRRRLEKVTRKEK